MKTYIRKKGALILRQHEHAFFLYDPEIRVTCDDDDVIAIQIQACIEEEEARRICELNIFPEIELPKHDDDQRIYLCLYLYGSKTLLHGLSRKLKEQKFVTPLEGVLHLDISDLPFYRNLGLYHLLKWKVLINKIN